MAENLAANAATVIVSFYTKTYAKSVNEEQTFSVPKTITKNGLSEIVNKLLAHKDDEAVPFDFLYNDEFISVSFDKFLKQRSAINLDDTLALEYTPAMSMEEGNEMPHDDWIAALAAPFYNADEDIVLTGCYDRRLRVCNGGEVLAIGDGHKGAVKSVAAVAVDGDWKKSGKKRARRAVPAFTAISGGKDCTVRVWTYDDANGLKNVKTLTHHQDSVDAVTINHAGDLAAVGSWDKNITLFRIPDCLGPTPAEEITLGTLAGHSRPVTTVKFSQDSRQVYSSGLDGQVKEWDVSRAKFIQTFSGEYSVYCLDVHPNDPSLLLTGHSDKRSRLWDVREKGPVKTFSGHLGWVYDAKWCPTGTGSSKNAFVTAAEDGAINLYDIRSQRPLHTHEVHTDGVLALAFTRPNVIASGGKDTKVRTTTLLQSEAAA